MTWNCFEFSNVLLSIEPENETTIKCLVNTDYLSFIGAQSEKT